LTRRDLLRCAAAQALSSALSGDTRKIPLFRDITASSGVNFVNQSSPTAEKYLPESMTGGVAIFDYDGDGWLDLFFVNGAKLSSPMAPGQQPDKSDPRFWNRLYRNNRNGTFTDVTAEAGLRGSGYGMGVAAGDYNNSGRPSLLVTNLDGCILYRNNGDGTFTDLTQKAGLLSSGWCAGASFFDFNRDGHLDLVVTRYLSWSFSKNQWCGERKEGYRAYCHPDKFPAVEHLLYKNNGDGTFTNFGAGAGFKGMFGKGLGVSIEDFNADGWPDIAIANDSVAQQLFINRNGTAFEEAGLALGLAYDGDGRAFAGMGIDSADLTNTGRPDIFIDALANQKYALFRNRNGSFDYESGESGLGAISASHSGWGAKFADMDNDGWKDLVIAQGHVMDNIALTQPWIKYLEPLAMLGNRQGRFEDISSQSGKPFSIPLAARGLAVGDLNNDGCLDLVINCNNSPALILKNEGATGNHWIGIDTVGTTSNREGIGACVSIRTASGLRQRAYVSAGGSYLSSSSKRVHFGLGQDRTIAELEIVWPSGIVQKMKDVPGDQRLTITESRR